MERNRTDAFFNGLIVVSGIVIAVLILWGMVGCTPDPVREDCRLTHETHKKALERGQLDAALRAVRLSHELGCPVKPACITDSECERL